MYVYVDLFIGLNMLLNSALLFLTAKLCDIRIRWPKLMLASGLGSLYALSSICSDWLFLYGMIGKFFASLLLLYIAFVPQQFRELVRLTAAYYGISFAVGGAVLGWFYFQQSVSDALTQSIHRSLNWQDLAGGILLATGLLFIIRVSLLANFLRKPLTYRLNVTYKERTASFIAIVDTGNGLYSLDGLPVIVTDYDAVANVLSRKVTDFFAQYPPTEWLSHIALCEDNEWLSRIRVIPFRALGGDNVLIGFRPDTIRISTGEKTIVTSQAVIGIYAGVLSANRYSALLHPAVFHLSFHEEVKECVLPG